jgi:hypothetical protein
MFVIVMFVALCSIFVIFFVASSIFIEISPPEVAHAQKNCQSLSLFTGTKSNQAVTKYHFDGCAARDRYCLVILNSWSNIQLTLYDATVIIALCEYFDCRKKLMRGKPGYNYSNNIQHASAMHVHRGGSFLMIAFFLIEDL